MKVPLPLHTLHLLDFCKELGVEWTWQRLANGMLPASRLRLATGKIEYLDRRQWLREVNVLDGEGRVTQKHPIELLEAGDLSWLTGGNASGREPDPIIVPYVTEEELVAMGLISPQSKNKRSAPSKTVSDKMLVEFLRKFADGEKTETECRTAAIEHFRGKKLPDKSVWRPAWSKIPNEQKRKRGNPARNSAK